MCCWLIRDTKKLLCLLVLCLLLPGCNSTGSPNDEVNQLIDKTKLMETYRQVVEGHRYIRHGLGGMDGKYALTNSSEAFHYSYAKGFRLYEIDL